ncbi:uncharacterized protein CANTADRAFT_39318, partial [Suhomyces tanzawaensis NRRL Y-17324]
KDIEGVFTHFDSLELSAIPAVEVATPATPSWIAHLSWQMNSTFVAPGDTFLLLMPCVYSVTLGKDTFELIAEGKTYAICPINNGELSDQDSFLYCTVTDEINNGDVVEGKAFIPVTFNIGGPGGSANQLCAQNFVPGLGQIYFDDGSYRLNTETNFGETAEFGRLATDLNNIVRYVPSSDSFEGFASSSSSSCPDDSTFNELTLMVPGATIDCDSVKINLAMSLNSW